MQNHCLISNKSVPQALYQKLQTKQNELWKNVRPINFQKPQLQSVSVFIKFVNTCLPLYLLWFLPSFTVLSFILVFHSTWWRFPLFEFLLISWHSSFDVSRQVKNLKTDGWSRAFEPYTVEGNEKAARQGREGAELWLLNAACLFRRKNKLNYDKYLFRVTVEHA